MPEFSSREYWEARFTKDGSPYDWLLSAQKFCEIALEWVEVETFNHAEVLHIGCGTSDASVLRELVEDPQQIHNVDYSRAAIEAAVAREQELLDGKEDQALLDTENRHDSVRQTEVLGKMRWSCLDLLSLDSTLSLLEQQAEAGKLFDLVLDKSTSDSIGCGSDVSLWLPYSLSINGWTRGILKSGVAQSADIHPLHVLAVHLAALTKPKTGKWIVISYSEDRMPFLPPFPQSASHGFLPESVIKAGFPHPFPALATRDQREDRLECEARRDACRTKEET